MKNYSEKKKLISQWKSFSELTKVEILEVLLLEKENKRTLMRDHKLLSEFSILEDTWKFSLLENTVNCTRQVFLQYVEIRVSSQIISIFKRTP